MKESNSRGMKTGLTAAGAVECAVGVRSADVTGMMVGGGVVADECRTGLGSGSGSNVDLRPILGEKPGYC